jgi:NADH:ubiquinone oxidoreductase subunit H
MGQWLLQISYNIGLGTSKAWVHDIWFTVMGALIFVCVVLPLILVVAYLTLWERKVLAWSHFRLGPNRAGPFGLFQPLCDAVKLLIKEDIVPLKIDWIVWFLAPIVAFAPMVACFLAIPMSHGDAILKLPHYALPQMFSVDMVAADFGVGILLIISLSSLVVVGIITAGIGSNNKYSMFGGVRSAGQIISYEVPVILCLLSVVLLTGSMSTVKIIQAQRFIPPRVYGQYLETDNLIVRAGDDFRKFEKRDGSELSDWATLASYFQNTSVNERGANATEAFEIWKKYRDDFRTKFDGQYPELNSQLKSEASPELVSQITNIESQSIQGKNFETGFMSYLSTKGSPHLPFIIPLLIAFIVYFIASVAETNRSPFDLPEGESEIVAGFHTEYTGIKFGLFFLGEYGNMILVSAIATTCFLGGYLGPALSFMKPIADTIGQFFYYFLWFCLKTGILVTVIIWFRATFPRLRVDQLTDFSWKVLVPISMLNLLIIGYLQFADWNLIKLLETNWILWYGNIAKIFHYPAVRILVLLISLPVISDILFPYRKIWLVKWKERIFSKFILFEIFFTLGFLGPEVYGVLIYSNYTVQISNAIVVISYAVSAVLAVWMVFDYIKARRSGVRFIPAILEERERRVDDLIEHQSTW